jgi:hypothetical protein
MEFLFLDRFSQFNTFQHFSADTTLRRRQRVAAKCRLTIARERTFRPCIHTAFQRRIFVLLWTFLSPAKTELSLPSEFDGRNTASRDVLVTVIMPILRVRNRVVLRNDVCVRGAPQPSFSGRLAPIPVSATFGGLESNLLLFYFLHKLKKYLSPNNVLARVGFLGLNTK